MVTAIISCSLKCSLPRFLAVEVLATCLAFCVFIGTLAGPSGGWGERDAIWILLVQDDLPWATPRLAFPVALGVGRAAQLWTGRLQIQY